MHTYFSLLFIPRIQGKTIDAICISLKWLAFAFSFSFSFQRNADRWTWSWKCTWMLMSSEHIRNTRNYSPIIVGVHIERLRIRSIALKWLIILEAPLKSNATYKHHAKVELISKWSTFARFMHDYITMHRCKIFLLPFLYMQTHFNYFFL